MTGKMEDADGLAPFEDDNAARRKTNRQDVLVFGSTIRNNKRLANNVAYCNSSGVRRRILLLKYAINF